MRVLIYGTSPLVGTGYGTAVRHTARHLKALGHEAAVFAWNSHVGPPYDLDGVPIYPQGYTQTGGEMIPELVQLHRADVLLAICDPWIMGPARWKKGHDARFVFWFPCQSEPASRPLMDSIAPADLALCYSVWGTEVMRSGGAANVRHCPLGVDGSLYSGANSQRAAARKGVAALIGVDLPEGRTLLGMVAANHPTAPACRKSMDVVLRAFARYLRDDPEAILYLHTCPNSLQGGTDLFPILRALDLKADQHVFFPDPCRYVLGYTEAAMATFFAAFDVCIQATMAEGFGLPILEAQAAGTPVIATRYSSMPELVRYGACVRPAAYIWSTPMVEGWVAVPSEAAIRNELVAKKAGIVSHWGDPSDGLALADELDWGVVVRDRLIPALESIL